MRKVQTHVHGSWRTQSVRAGTRRAGAALVAGCLALGGTSVLAAEPGGEAKRPADAQAQAVKDKVNGTIERASAWTAGALDWMSKKGRAAKEASDDWRARAEASLKQAVESALSSPPPEMGLRGFRAADADGVVQGWVGISGPDAMPGALPTSVVLLVHGLDEPGGVWGDLAPALAADGHRVLRFDYANDQGCARSAAELGAALVALRALGVERVSIVGHSMGGLVARDAITRPGMLEALPVPRVDRLIMVGTPNKGSELARLRFVAEGREHLVRWFEAPGMDPRVLLGFLKDGAGEAGADLLPGSAFLADLNARPLPEGVVITNIVGTATREEAEWLGSVLENGWVTKVLSTAEISRGQRALANLADALGDGVVSSDSASLPGVSDEVRVTAQHRFMLRSPPLEKEARAIVGEPQRVPSAIPIILDRLKQPLPQPPAAPPVAR